MTWMTFLNVTQVKQLPDAICDKKKQRNLKDLNIVIFLVKSKLEINLKSIFKFSIPSQVFGTCHS